jgi:hypothetical protein
MGLEGEVTSMKETTGQDEILPTTSLLSGNRTILGKLLPHRALVGAASHRACLGWQGMSVPHPCEHFTQCTGEGCSMKSEQNIAWALVPVHPL